MSHLTSLLFVPFFFVLLVPFLFRFFPYCLIFAFSDSCQFCFSSQISVLFPVFTFCFLSPVSPFCHRSLHIFLVTETKGTMIPLLLLYYTQRFPVRNTSPDYVFIISCGRHLKCLAKKMTIWIDGYGNLTFFYLDAA